ncbi:DUF3576 domain-containing protein [Chachezhania sediminis]|uniref:DUF3576 domain-containing protein n=1 Tax=Chachezhania sediminis TaxID=2599291 RepID=UPI00131CC5DA|nr:DUF3576 domain-containing protein [Chachezhania sediminis]
MRLGRFRRNTLCLCLAALAGLAACSRNGPPAERDPDAGIFIADEKTTGRTTIWDAFGPDKSGQEVQVNRYLWFASLDVLSFLPIQSVDPFTGIIVTGYGRPPGGGRSYRATVHVKDPSLTARSLRVSLQTQGGPVSPATTRAVEDAILSRARQLRIADNKL